MKSNLSFWLKNHRVPIVLAFLIQLLVFVGFRIESAHYRQRSKQTVEAVLRNESAIANSYALSKSVSDLELLKAVSCVVITEKMDSDRVFYDTSNGRGCYQGSALRSFLIITTQLNAISGISYELRFQVPSRLNSIFLEVLLYLIVCMMCFFHVQTSHRQKLLFEAQLSNQRLESALTISKADALNLVARQVSHDIRSPLATLISVHHTAQGLDEASRVQLRTAVNRIRDMANNLLAKSPGHKTLPVEAGIEDNPNRNSQLSSESCSVDLLSALIESSVSQKRLQFVDAKDIEIESCFESSAFGAFANLQPTEFHRMLSNIINNSVEAIENGGRVAVRLAESQGRAILSVEDNGKGIPAELLTKVVERGGTFGKEGGNGLGLSHCKLTVEAWGGRFKVESVQGEGTKIKLEIPLVEPPRWFAESVRIGIPSTVVIVDDDPSIHALWEQRFSQLTPKPTMLHFTSSDAILAWYRKSLGSVENPVYLCDFELIGSKLNGLEIIDMLGIAPESILVTSRADEMALRDKCLGKGIRLLPKQLAAFVPIESAETYG